MPQRAERGPGRLLPRLVLLSLLMGSSIGLARFTTALHALELGVQGSMLSLVAAAQSAGMLALGLSAGGWVARFGAHRVFVAGSGLAAAAYALLPSSPHVAWLVALTAVAGCGMPLRFVSLNAVFMSHVAEIGESRAGWFRATHIAGMSLLGPMLAAGLLPLIGNTSMFLLVCACFALAVPMAPLVFDRAGRAPGAAVPRARTVEGVRARALFADPEARRLAAQEFALQALNSYYAFYIVVIAVRQLGMDAMHAGALVAVQGLALVLGLFSFGPIAARCGHRAAPAASTAVILALLVLATASHERWLWPAAVVLGLAPGALQHGTLAGFSRLGARLSFPRSAALNALAGPSGALAGGLLGGLFQGGPALQLSFLAFVPVFAGLARLQGPSHACRT